MRIFRRISVRTFAILVVCLFLVIVCNLLLLSIHNTDQKEAEEKRSLSTVSHKLTSVIAVTLVPNGNLRKQKQINKKQPIVKQLQLRWENVKLPWNKLNNSWSVDDQKLSTVLIGKLHRYHGPEVNLFAAKTWELAGSWVRPPRQIYPKQTPGLNSILRNLANEKITKAGLGHKGTQLKLTLELNGGQKVLFKPMRYEREEIFVDTPYAGADRHNGEIAAFHLSRLLELRWCPLVSGRKVNLKREILPVVQDELRKTFFMKKNDTCFYGVCYYCNRNDPVCANGTVLEGAVILWLPPKYGLKVHRHPWARTYRNGIDAIWEKNDSYCEMVKKVKPYNSVARLLDIIDVAMFDFLTGNADRHRYETFESFPDSIVLLMDNGKSLGNPFHDEISILAPLYHCCMVRSSTVEVLKSFRDRSLSFSLETLLKTDPLYPILTDGHLLALDRRRQKILDVIKWCLEHYDSKHVFKNGV